MNTYEYVRVYDIGNKFVGIDLGIKELVVTDDGERVHNLNMSDKYFYRLAYLKHKYSRMSIGSNNRERLRLVIARLYERISNIKMDYIHKFTHRIVKDNTVIAVEDLNIKGMMSNKKKRRYKSKLSRHISDACWHEILRQLEYKAFYNGRWFVKVPVNYPSTQLCNICGYKNISLKNNLSIRDWICPNCKTKHDRDVNAAINILNKGMMLLGLV